MDGRVISVGKGWKTWSVSHSDLMLVHIRWLNALNPFSEINVFLLELFKCGLLGSYPLFFLEFKKDLFSGKAFHQAERAHGVSSWKSSLPLPLSA